MVQMVKTFQLATLVTLVDETGKEQTVESKWNLLPASVEMVENRPISPLRSITGAILGWEKGGPHTIEVRGELLPPIVGE